MTKNTIGPKIYCQAKPTGKEDGRWICEGMDVNEVSYITDSQQRQGWVTETMDEKEGQGKMRVQVVRVDGEILDEDDFYETDFEPGSNWCKALVDG